MNAEELSVKVPRSSWFWGFSCEFLMVRDILDLNVPELMKEYDFGLFLKMYEADFDPSFAELLKKLETLGIDDHFFPWPVLPLHDGYYPNINTVEKFTAMIERMLDWYTCNEFKVPEHVLIDIEPDVDVDKFKKTEELRLNRALIRLDAAGKIIPVDPEASNAEVKAERARARNKGNLNIFSTIGKVIDQIDEMSEARFEKATRQFQHLVDMMHARGTRALCVALPLSFSDLHDGKNLLQDFQTTPVQTVSWDWINYMIFAEPFKAILDHNDYVHLIHTYCKDFAAHHGDKASICFGITGFGKEFHQIDPELYLKEFNASLACGVNKLGIFCLENILALGEDKFRHFCSVVNGADGTFDPDPERLEFARKLRKVWECLDHGLAPAIVHLVKSGRAMHVLQKFTGGGLK